MISKSSSIESIREQIRKSEQYTAVRGRYLLGSLVTSGPVSVVMARMIKAVDDGFSYDGIGSVPDAVPSVTQRVLGWKVLLSAVHALGRLRRLVKRRRTATPRGDDRPGGASLGEDGPQDRPSPPEDTITPSQPPGSSILMRNPTPAVPIQQQLHVPANDALALTVSGQELAAPVRAFDLS